MSEEKVDCAVEGSCLMKVLSFLEFQMSDKEMTEFGVHLHECADCRDYLGILAGMLPYGDEMLRLLSRGESQ